MADNRLVVEVDVVRRLIASQFPQWAGLAIRPVDTPGWDNRTFRLGADMIVRMPSASSYAGQVAKEQRWLPVLAPHLPLPIPTPLAVGSPAEGYPWSWSVYRWLGGDTAAVERIDDHVEFAVSLAGFLKALQAIDAREGPAPGVHNFYRGGPVSTYDDETRRALRQLEGRIDTRAAADVWEAALAAPWRGHDIWVHGDVAVGNLLVESGRLCAVIDFGCMAAGDPACDLIIAWTFLLENARLAFRAAMGVDDAMWARARGWALWKALITVARQLDTSAAQELAAARVVDEVLAEFRAGHA